jgi:hypothetical protein
MSRWRARCPTLRLSAPAHGYGRRPGPGIASRCVSEPCGSGVAVVLVLVLALV